MIRICKNCCSRWLRKLSVAALLLALLTGCQPAATRQEDTLRVGLALYTLEDTFISTVTHDLERLAWEAEEEYDLKITLSVQDGRTNQTAQLEQVDSLLDRGCSVLCVNIVDRTAAAVIIDKAEKAGVPLIFFNRQPVAEDIERWENVYYVGASAEQSGLLQGNIVLDAWQADRSSIDRSGDNVLQYVMLEGEPGHQDALLRTEYAIKPLLEQGVELEKLDSGTANWNRGQASAKTSQWIEQYGSGIEAVFANNDDMALGAIDAFRAAGAELPLIVGVDGTAPALDAVAAGELKGTVLNDAEGIARAILDLSLAFHHNQEPGKTVALADEHYVWLPYRQITISNLPEFIRP